MQVRPAKTYEAIRILPETVSQIASGVCRATIDHDLAGNPYIRVVDRAYLIGTWLVLTTCDHFNGKWEIVESLNEDSFHELYEWVE